MTKPFVRFGYDLFESNIQECQADNKEFLDAVPPTHALALSEMGIKFHIIFFGDSLTFFLTTTRHCSVPVLKNSASGCHQFEIETFHVEAGVDDFQLLCMYFDLPAGC